jgi:hypothetical protein
MTGGRAATGKALRKALNQRRRDWSLIAPRQKLLATRPWPHESDKRLNEGGGRLLRSRQESGGSAMSPRGKPAMSRSGSRTQRGRESGASSSSGLALAELPHPDRW